MNDEMLVKIAVERYTKEGGGTTDVSGILRFCNRYALFIEILLEEAKRKQP